MSLDHSLESKLRHFVTEIQNTLSRGDVIKDDLQWAFDSIGELLGISVSSTLLARFPNMNIYDVRRHFEIYHYGRLLEFVIEQFTIEWIKNIQSVVKKVSIEDVFLKGNPKETFMVLSKYVSQKDPGYRLHKCVGLLEQFIQAEKFIPMFWCLCQIQDNGVGQLSTTASPKVPHGSYIIDSFEREQWEVLNAYVVTLPERVTNKLKAETSRVFYPQEYIPIVCNSMVSCCVQIHKSIQKNKDISMAYLNSLLGKLCMCGHGELVWSNLLPSLLPLMLQDSLWCRVSERLVTGVPDQQLESVITPLVLHITWFGHMSKFLGHSVLENPKVKFLLTNKLLLLRHFKQPRILQNIFGYLSESGTLKPLFFTSLVKLLSVWGDKGALKHTSYEQHLYIAKAILVASAFLTEKDAKQMQSEIMEHLMVGIQNHLDSAIPSVRRQGMIVSETLTSKIHLQKEKLKFEYEDDAESNELKSLLTIPEDLCVEPIQNSLANTHIHGVKEPEPSTPQQAQTNKRENEGQLDSDDDLEPYDLSNDQKTSKVKAPLYIRDCMEGLIKSGEDPEKLEVCLQTAEKLIRQHSTTAREVSVEFTKILLHLQDSFSLPGFTTLRHSSMVAMLVVEPEKVAEYLTTQFYERNYNIRQRLDILEVLCAGAKELSDPKKDKIDHVSDALYTVQLYGKNSDRQDLLESEAPHWKDIVQKRIASKTRRFASGRSNKEAIPVANRFMSVAGGFFFPLLANFDRPENTLDMLGEDHIVLGRLVYSLGIIIHAAQHSPVCRNMGKSLLEFVWAVRYHPQQSIRQGLLFSTCMVFLALPHHILFEDLQSYVTETKTWLQDVASGDTDHECQKLAVEGLVILENLLKQQFSESGT